MFVMNERIYSNLHKLLNTLKKDGLSPPYYSVTDYGQRVSLYWDLPTTTSISGSLLIHKLDLYVFVNDLLIEDKTFMLDGDSKSDSTGPSGIIFDWNNVAVFLRKYLQ